MERTIRANPDAFSAVIGFLLCLLKIRPAFLRRTIHQPLLFQTAEGS